MSAPTPVDSLRRDILNGHSILDSTQGSRTSPFKPKGEAEHDTYHTVELTDRTVKIIKRSRINSDLVSDLMLREPLVEYLPPGDQEKIMLVTSECLGEGTGR